MPAPNETPDQALGISPRNISRDISRDVPGEVATDLRQRKPHRTAKIRPLSNLSSGFTLIEIMIVMAIITAVLAIGGIRLADKSGGYRAKVRLLGGLIRSIRNNARLYNNTCRLVINMDEDKGHRYSVECAPGNALLKSEEQEEAEKKENSLLKEKKKSLFAPDNRILKGEVKLPRGLYFGSVEFTDRSKPIVDGPAYIYFFPQGLVEESAVHITDRKTLNWTLALNPLTGKPDLFEKDISLKDLRQQQ